MKPKENVCPSELSSGSANSADSQTSVLNGRGVRIPNVEDLFVKHTKAVADFLSEMYATMVDPLAEGTMKVPEMMEVLLKTAREQRQQIDDFMRTSKPVGDHEYCMRCFEAIRSNIERCNIAAAANTAANAYQHLLLLEGDKEV